MMILWISVMLLSKMYTAYSEVVHQPDSVVTVSVGDNVTLHCSVLIEDHSDPIVWYKQTSGHQPRVVLLVQKFAEKPHFYNEFQSSRFTVERAHEICHLKISNVISSDEAMYYCGWRKYETVFAEGTYLALKGSQNNQHKFNVSIHQHPVSVSVYPGDTVTLLCSVSSKHTTADMTMFWFRSDSGKSVPEIIYTRNQSDQCEIDTFKQNCTYNLSKNIVSQTDTGTYYCALVTCGTILFGNGSKTKMGRVVKLMPRRDKCIRAVEVQVKDKVYTRPVACLIPLPELPDNTENSQP
ncbi:tyrosine-protein phosphatase non-receptor type substrate 1-like [Xyrauchen texanus]|uniref:tyrosine-protein phosphatase non-receptor type substrate 1-like n=1 Tax=Xyrauchen texanus TaxID=154827 RepID=UPI0022424830|nr:tyrosine-protein phosphatase non-receptor type substrate 1-like [Xyrauchen texanus]